MYLLPLSFVSHVLVTIVINVILVLASNSCMTVSIDHHGSHVIISSITITITGTGRTTTGDGMGTTLKRMNGTTSTSASASNSTTATSTITTILSRNSQVDAFLSFGYHGCFAIECKHVFNDCN